ncbi:MAG TPA: LysM peptidoglycan-binding domain-containing protein [Desulfuromonadaceae bacterium]
MDDLGRQDAPKMFPQEYSNLVETFEHGEAVLHVQHDYQQADNFYLFAMQKATLLQAELKFKKDQLAEQERRLAALASARLEEEQLLIKAAEAEVRLRQQERLAAEEAAKAYSAKFILPPKENIPSQNPFYTVRRGETLPQIAARNEIYNDSSLWPIIYRANRDQIRDPKQLWPGQVLKIPRHISREEVLEAKRYAGRKF